MQVSIAIFLSKQGKEKGMQENQEMEKLRRELRRTRVFCGITSVLVAALLVGGALVFTKVQSYVEAVLPLAEQVSAVEFDTLNETIGSMNETLKAVDWEKFSAQMEQLDVEALNEAIAGLDTEELSEALEKLNQVTDTLESFGNSIRDFLSKFGSGSLFGS